MQAVAGKKITILLGSPDEQGATAALCRAFTKGAEAEGAKVETISVGNLAVSPVNALFLQRFKAGENVDSDGIGAILDKLLASDVIVLATPVYFFGMSSQLKLVLDRFVTHRDELVKHPAQACLLASAGSDGPNVMDALVLHFDLLCAFFKWNSGEKVLAKGTVLKPLSELNVIPEAEALGHRMGKGSRAVDEWATHASAKSATTATTVNTGNHTKVTVKYEETAQSLQRIQPVVKPSMVVVEGKPAGYKKPSKL